jgi:hypothetical protein
MADIPHEFTAEKLVKVYRRIRAAREQNTAEYNKKDAELKEQLDMVGKMLINIMDEQGALSLRTGEGSVTKVVKNKYWNVDWPAFNEFVREKNLLDLFEHRIAQKNMAEFLESNPGVAVPGLQMDRRYDVVVRKPTEKPGEQPE